MFYCHKPEIEKSCFLQVRIMPKNTLKKKTKETVKQELLRFLQDHNELEEPGLDETSNTTKRPFRIYESYTAV